MKLRVDKKRSTREGILEMKLDTLNDIEVVEVPLQDLYLWYPFNINYEYRYSKKNSYMHLVAITGRTGDDVYKMEEPSNSPRMVHLGNTFYNEAVAERNKTIIWRAHNLGISTLDDEFNYTDVQNGFSDLDVFIQTVKDRIEDRVDPADFEGHLSKPDMKDRAIYAQATDTELRRLQEFGEIYTMLSLMRKMVSP
jgi:hypothetical protein